MVTKYDFMALGIIALLVLAGAMYSIYLGNDLRIWDEQEYVALAKNIVTKHVYSLDGQIPTALRPPGYPLALAFLVSWGAEVVHLRLFNIFLLGTCTWLLYSWLRRQRNAIAGLVGVGMVVGYPVLLYSAGNLYPQTLGALLLLAALSILSKTKVTTLQFLLAAVLLGYLVLVIPTMAFPLLIIVGWLVLARHQARSAAIVTLASLLIIGPWTFRNYIVFNSFVFVSTNSGFNLLIGNSEETTPMSGLNVNFQSFMAQTTGMDELQSDAYYRSRAIEFIVTHPTHAFRLYVLKVLNHFNFRNDLVVEPRSPLNPDIVMLLSYGGLLGLFLARLILFRRLDLSSVEWLMVTLYVSYAFAQAVFFTRIRFRLPFDFLLIALDALFVHQVARETRKLIHV